MNHSEIIDFICHRIHDVAVAKGSKCVAVSGETAILGGALPLDSLDLAGIVVELENETGIDPFCDGLINFHTVSELAGLYCGGQ